MKKILATTLGVILATGAVAALADRQDRASRSAGETHMRLTVTPESGGRRVVVCSVSRDGASSLADRDGVALAPPSEGQTVGLVEGR